MHSKVIQLCFSVAQLYLTLCNPMNCSTPGFPVLHHLLELTQTPVHWVGDAIQSSCPLSSLSPLPSIFTSIRVFSNESALHIRWPKYWSFSIIPSTEYSGLISFRNDWFWSPCSPSSQKSAPTPWFESINSSALSLPYGPSLWSHSYMTTGKTIALTIWTFVGKKNLKSILFQSLFPYRLLQNIEYSSLCYIVGSCWLPISIYSSVCVLIHNSYFIPPHTLSALVIISLFSMSMALILFCKYVHLYYFLDSTYKQ